MNVLIKRSDLKKLIESAIKPDRDLRYKEHYDSSYKESNLPDDPEEWPEKHKRDSKLSSENIKNALIRFLPPLNITLKEVSVGSDFVNIVVDTKFFKNMNVEIFLPPLQGLAYEIYNKRYKYKNSLFEDVFQYIFEPIRKYSNHYNQMIMSDRVEKMLEYAVANGYPEADTDFALAVDAMRNNPNIQLGKIDGRRPYYNDNTGTYYEPNISLDDEVLFHELDHRHDASFVNFNKKMKLKVIREGDPLYVKEKEGKRKDNPIYRNPLYEYFPTLNKLDKKTGFFPSFGKEAQAELEQLKGVVKNSIYGSPMIGDFIINLPPIDFNIDYIKKIYNSENYENIEDHDHDHDSVTLYNLKLDHIDETIHRLGMYADNKGIDISSKEKAIKYIERWLSGNYDDDLRSGPYHDLAGLGVIINNTDRSVEWFVNELMSTVKTFPKKQKDTFKA